MTTPTTPPTDPPDPPDPDPKPPRRVRHPGVGQGIGGGPKPLALEGHAARLLTRHALMLEPSTGRRRFGWRIECECGWSVLVYWGTRAGDGHKRLAMREHRTHIRAIKTRANVAALYRKG